MSRRTSHLSGLGVDIDHRDVCAEWERRLRRLEVTDAHQGFAVGAGDVGPTDRGHRRAGDVERAGIGVEHDIVDRCLQQVGGTPTGSVGELAGGDHQ